MNAAEMAYKMGRLTEIVKLQTRLIQADTEILELRARHRPGSKEWHRLDGKAQGVRLARAYVEEILREAAS